MKLFSNLLFQSKEEVANVSILATPSFVLEQGTFHSSLVKNGMTDLEGFGFVAVVGDGTEVVHDVEAAVGHHVQEASGDAASTAREPHFHHAMLARVSLVEPAQDNARIVALATQVEANLFGTVLALEPLPDDGHHAAAVAADGAVHRTCRNWLPDASFD